MLAAANDALPVSSPARKTSEPATPLTAKVPPVRVDLIRLAAEEQERQFQAEEELAAATTQVFDNACVDMSTASQDSQLCHHVPQPTDKEIQEHYDIAMSDLDSQLSQTSQSSTTTSTSSSTKKSTSNQLPTSGCVTTPTPAATTSTAEPTSEGKFRLRHKKIGLTYPQCPVTIHQHFLSSLNS